MMKKFLTVLVLGLAVFAISCGDKDDAAFQEAISANDVTITVEVDKDSDFTITEGAVGMSNGSGSIISVGVVTDNTQSVDSTFNFVDSDSATVGNYVEKDDSKYTAVVTISGKQATMVISGTNASEEEEKEEEGEEQSEG